MIELNTPHLNLPLPHPDNDLEDDVLRLGAALEAVDTAVHGVQQQLGAKADAEATALELQALESSVQALQADKADAASVATALAGKANKATTLAGYGITDGVKAELAANYDSTTLMAMAPLGQWVSYLAAGAAGADWPTTNATAWWNVFTFGSESRATQFAQQAFNVGAVGALFYRSKHDTTWSAWRRVALHSDAVVATTGPMDCNAGNYFTITVGAATALSFTNVPAGAYACVLEVSHTAGTITLPAGAVWAGGSAPTLQTGKRHLFYFQKSSTGSGGWIVSALANSAP
ncbi:hypothetical protein [Diaphorobacter nitroreducens]